VPYGIESRAFASAEALLESDSVQTATCLLLDVHLEGILGDQAAAPAFGIGIEVPRHLHDRGRR
jgi:FixJ family two-component response regulator